MSGVLLVVAPFASLDRPAIGVSTLKAALATAGVACDVYYPNIAFAAVTSVDASESIARSPAHLLVGEWVFAHLAFGRREVDWDYLDWVTPQVECDADALLRFRDAAESLVAEAVDEIVRRKPRIVGFSTTFQQNAASLAIAAGVRSRLPHAVICFGGANCEGPMGRALLRNFPQIDAVFSGESDATFPEFVRRVYAGESLSFDASISVRGFAAVSGAPSARIEDLDTLAVPDYDEYFAALHEHGLSHLGLAIQMETSRGCWWGERKHCRFCGLNGYSLAYRAKSAARVLWEADELVGRYGVKNITVTDNILYIPHVDSVFGPLEERKAPYRFFYEIKANMTPAQMGRLARGGVYMVQPGIESLDDEPLRLMEKGVSALQNIRLMRVCTEYGIVVVWNILIGIPHEPQAAYERMLALIPLLEHLPPPKGLGQIRLDRFSPYFERAGELGFVDVRPAAAYATVYGLPEAELREIAYYYDGNPVDSGIGPLESELRSVVTRWRNRYHQDEGPPVLSALELGPLVMIRDTRSCAVKPLRALSEPEAAMLQALRGIGVVDAVLDEHALSYPHADARAIFADLVAWKYVAVDGNRAVSLVAELAERAERSDSRYADSAEGLSELAG